MASFTAEIEFDVTCDKCGDSLSYTEKNNSRYATSYELKVEPCEKCMDEKDDDLNAALEKIKEDTDYYEEELQRLRDELDALKIEMTYGVIKKNEVTICH